MYKLQTVGALNCIIKRRLYRGKISYLQCEPEPTEQTTTQTNDSTDSPQEQTDKPQEELSDKTQQEHPETASSSEERKVDVNIDLEEEKEESKVEVANTDTIEQTGTGEQKADQETSPPTSIQVEAQTTTSSQSELSADSASSTQDNKQPTEEDFSQFGPKANLLPSLSGPVPETWETIESDFMAVTLLMIPHMAHNVFGDPAFAIGTGKIRVVVVNDRVTRIGMFGLLTKADTGEHLDMNGVIRKDVKAFRIEPQTSPGMLTVDGEEVYYGPLQCQIHPTLARVMSRKRRV